MLKLLFETGDQAPLWVVDKSFTLGSAEDNHLILDDPTVSLQHARIVKQEDGYWLRDLGSQQGSYVNNQPVTQKLLGNRDVIRLGDVALRVIDPFVDEAFDNNVGWSLVACSSWLSGQEFKLIASSSPDRSSLIVGRGKHCDIILPGTHLSREHVEIELGENALHVVDLRSANGTYINDQRIEQGWVKPGDTLRLDVYNFRVIGPNMANVRGSERNQPAPETAEDLSWELLEADEPKRWKTRSTSPGNRSESGSTIPENKMSLCIAAGLAIAAGVLVLYLIVF